MKKIILTLIVSLFVLITSMSFVGCGLGSSGSPTDYNADVQIVAPEEIDTEHFVVDDDTTYYTSPGFSLCMEVNGEFLIMDYFSLDGTKRIYDNLFFYVEDYFYIVTDDYKELYASLSDSVSAEYAEEEKEQGEDVQINIKKAGIYKLTFDVSTLKFDLEYKSEIQNAVYYTIKNCSIFTLATNWVEMTVNPDNQDEFVINNFSVEAGKDISFYNNVHVSNYKVTLDANCNAKLGSVRKTFVTMNVGGRYDIYNNRKTYVVRLELLNPDTATYSCVYYDEDREDHFETLQPNDNSVPYIFSKRISVDRDITSVPDFYTANYRTYKLDVAPSDLISGSGKYYYFRKAGTYDLTINLKTFTISVQKLPE